MTVMIMLGHGDKTHFIRLVSEKMFGADGPHHLSNIEAITFPPAHKTLTLSWVKVRSKMFCMDAPLTYQANLTQGNDLSFPKGGVQLTIGVD